MDKDLFKVKVSEVGSIVRSKGGINAEIAEYQDTHFRPKPDIKPCGDCGRTVSNRVVVYEVKWGYKEIPYWLKRCSICKQKTPLKNTSTK